MSPRTRERIGHLAWSAFCLAVLTGFAPLAFAQTVCGSTTPGGAGVVCTEETALTGQTCGFDRGGTNCTANDFVGNASVTSNTVADCHIGDVLTNQSLRFQITSASSARFSPGLFIGEQSQPLNATGGTCSVVTFPTTSTGIVGDSTVRTPFPWVAATAGDACGSYTKDSTSLEQIDGVTFTCDPDVNNFPQITYMIVYANNQAGASLCGGPADVAPENASKCSSGGTPITNVTVTYNANPTCTGASTATYDPVAGTVTLTFTITNNGPDAAGPALGGDVTFTDTVPAPVVVQSATCGTPTGGAVCGTTGNVGNVVSGSITTMPNGSSVKITIVGTVASGLTDVIDNVPTLSVNGQVVIVPGGWLNTCPASVTLPVHLQDFDVK